MHVFAFSFSLFSYFSVFFEYHLNLTPSNWQSVYTALLQNRSLFEETFFAIVDYSENSYIVALVIFPIQ